MVVNRSFLIRVVSWALPVLILFALGASLPAQAPPAGGPAPATPAPVSSIDSGATAWMLASTALVLLMTPGLALFYGGMVRTKNVLGTMAHSVFAMGIITVQWVIFGYSFAFGGDFLGGLLGDPGQFLFLKDVAHDAPKVGTPDRYPHMVFMAFQLMFAIITPALITGAFAERVKFGAYIVFALLWSTFVYDPLAHWVWGGGILSSAEGSWLKGITGTGALDFAGGTVVHISSGVSALAFVLLTGKRRGYPAVKILPNNLNFTVLGAGLLWFGWFGFNGGSALASDGLAGLAFTVTHIAAAAAAVSWAAVEWLHRGKASVLGIVSGLVAGLVCITPASGFVGPMSALIMGLAVSPVCYFFITVVKVKLGYDDSLDVFGIHGIGGTMGALLTGVFCQAKYNPAGADGLLAGSARQLGAQAIATLVTWVFAFVATCVIVKVVDLLIGVRVDAEDEESGIDLSQHGETGYNF
jgi:Amt family ammonium transporter